MNGIASRAAAVVALAVALACCPARAQSGGGEPVREAPGPAGAPAPVSATPDYARDIAPLLATYCTKCHGPERAKGGLRLDAIERMREGGKHGPVLRGDDGGPGEIVRRLRLPADDADHMPPRGKAQPDPAAVARIESWVVAGAPGSAAAASPAPAAPSAPALPRAESAREPDAAALAALREVGVHVEPLRGARRGVRIELGGATSRIDDAGAARLLEPVLAHVGELVAAGSVIGDASLALFARMPELRRLDLRGTAVTSAGLAALRGHAAIAELSLVRTRVDGAAVDVLAAMPALERVWLWGSLVGPPEVAKLRAARPELHVDAGDAEPAKAVETEPEVRLKREAAAKPEAKAEAKRSAPPAAPAGAGGDAAREGVATVNAKCPVSGKAVDARYTILHEGRLVGLCCPKCAEAFWNDPERAAKLEAASR